MLFRKAHIAALLCLTACASHDGRTEVDIPTVLPSAGPVSTPSARVDAPWRADERFRLRVEQRGANVPVADHKVTLARRAFTLVFELRDLDFIKVNASYTPETLERARSNDSLTNPDDAFSEGRGAAEEVDPPHGIFVDDGSFNYWGWDGDTHRCHVHEVRANLSTCTRIIEKLRTGGEVTLVQKSTAKAIYVVVVATAAREGETVQELQRDWLTFTFQ